MLIKKEINIIGCDPGAKGAMCFLRLIPGKTPVINFLDYSTNYHDSLVWIHAFDHQYDIQRALIEDVHSLYGMSAKSNFNFGKNLGISETLLSIHSFGLDKVQPKIWQKAFGVTTKGKNIKKEVASICQELYPGCTIFGPRGGLMDGRSDALALAHYCAQQYISKEK